MTDKQIIIDGVDVSGCCCIENGYCLWVKKYYETGLTPKCEQVKDCYYKQLKRKEQECEELKENYFTVIQQRNKAEKTLTEIKEIAEKQMEICSCKFDLNNYESGCRGCSSKDARVIAKQILQKISEVEDV